MAAESSPSHKTAWSQVGTDLIVFPGGLSWLGKTEFPPPILTAASILEPQSQGSGNDTNSWYSLLL